jgi:hypothetical protein
VQLLEPRQVASRAERAAGADDASHGFVHGRTIDRFSQREVQLLVDGVPALGPVEG